MWRRGLLVDREMHKEVRNHLNKKPCYLVPYLRLINKPNRVLIDGRITNLFRSLQFSLPLLL